MKTIIAIFSKLNFIIFVIGTKFYRKQRWKQFVRLMTNTSVLPSILLGIVTLASGIIGNYTIDDKKGITDLYPISILIISTFLIITSSIIFGRVFFKAQTPEDYAKNSIAGTTPSYSFIYIAYCIWKECLFVLKHDYIFSFFNTSAINQNLNDIDSFKKKLDGFNNRFQKRYDEIQKINFMILDLSKSMYIPPHRISDFLFQFSPDIYYQEIKNAIQKMDELYFMIKENKDSRNTEKFKKTALQVFDIYQAVGKRKRYQKDIILHRDLHNFIINMSSGYGLSDAFGSYCLGLQFSVKPRNNTKPDKDKLRNRLLFMYHKRRMYPGFDLHALLYSFVCKLDEEEGGFYSFRTALSKVSQNIERGLDSASAQELGELKTYMEDLSKTYEDFKTTQRENIYKKFREEIIGIISTFNIDLTENANNSKNKIVIITQGYSSVVNYVLRRIAEEIQVASSAKGLSELVPVLEKKNVILEYYILENPDRNLNHEKVVSRHLRYKFKENPNIPKKSQYKINVKVVDEEWLKALIKDNIGARTIILSGAEFIQERADKQNRIINNETISKFIKDLKSNQNQSDVNNNYDWYVLAENYKFFPEDIDNNITYKIAMTNDYLEELQLCDWSSDRIIITGEKKGEKEEIENKNNQEEE